jgi:hypothetical protein
VALCLGAKSRKLHDLAFYYVVLQVGVGNKADELALPKKIIVSKSKEVKTGSNMAESFKEGYG